jgi:hypothetical protein
MANSQAIQTTGKLEMFISFPKGKSENTCNKFRARKKKKTTTKGNFLFFFFSSAPTL